MELNKETLIESFKLIERLPHDFNIDDEVEHIINLVKTELSETLYEYTFKKIEGIGGSGIVFSAIYDRFNIRRAIKIPRKKIYEDTSLKPQVDPELEALSKLSHKNITRLYESKSFSRGGFCAITEYVEDALPLDLYVKELCCSSENRNNEYIRNQNLRKLAFIIYDTVDALYYMHETGKLIHFDVKPDNILISKNHVPYITDLGFARDMEKYKEDEIVDVGFTFKYAHKDLTNTELGARISQTPLKAKNKIVASKITPIIDLFAFGRTLQELLKILEKEYSEEIYSDYIFNYIHLVACLSMDGKGANDARTGTEGDFVTDTALGIELSIFNQKKYKDFSNVLEALQRLLSLKAIEVDLPELDAWSSNTINVSDIGIPALTPRVKSIIEHPLFEKLYDEHQLGMLDAIFPTVSHTRFQHSLGVYHATCQYILSLYNDKDNPTFKIFYNKENCSKLILSSLVHDIGQTSFGHELEEIDQKEFSHEEIGKNIILSDTSKDYKGRTLMEIITNKDYDCWNIKIDDIYTFISNKSEDAFDGILYDIFDGQIDADKLDYLIRDSVESRVKYGHGIDYNRFIRSLTTYSSKGSKTGKLRLAVKRKGAASAESFVFARYQLYQSLYWHHTFRAIKAMFLSSAIETTKELKKEFRSDTDIFRNPLRAFYLNYVIGVPEENLPMGNKSKITLKKIKDLKDIPFNGKYSENKTLLLFWKLAKDDKSKALLSDVINRNIYKRVLELPLSKIYREENEKIFDNKNRPQLENEINQALENLIRKKIQDHSTIRESTTIDNILEKFEMLLLKYRSFVIDFPTRGWSSTGSPPPFIIDFKRRHFRVLNYSDDSSIEKSKIWNELQSEMMKEIADFRVYCHPEMHNIVRKHVSSSEIFYAIAEHVKLKHD